MVTSGHKYTSAAAVAAPAAAVAVAAAAAYGIDVTTVTAAGHAAASPHTYNTISSNEGDILLSPAPSSIPLLSSIIIGSWG
jgi:predicted porin